jgi:ketosteroid isomerase-like protein
VSALMHRLAIGANGQPYDNEYNFMFRFESGLIAEVWEVMDTALAFRLLAIDSATPR